MQNHFLYWSDKFLGISVESKKGKKKEQKKKKKGFWPSLNTTEFGTINWPAKKREGEKKKTNNEDKHMYRWKKKFFFFFLR